MPILTDVINVPDMVGYVRDMSVLAPPNLSSVLPDMEVDDIEYELRNLDQTVVDVASFRSWDAPPPLGRRQGFSTIKGEIAPMGQSYTLNEREMARFANLMAGLSGAGGDSIAAIYRDGVRAGVANQARIEIARADLLTDGVLTINENGFKITAGFNVPGGHIVTAATAWTDAAAPIIANFLAWQATYRAANGGVNPDAWLVSEDVVGNMALNTEVRTSLGFVGGIGVPNFINEGQVRQILGARGIAPIIVFSGRVPDPTTGLPVATLGARKVIGVRRGMGNTLWTTPPVAGILQAAGARLERRMTTGIVSYVEWEARPARVVTTAEAVALPILRDPKALFVATV